MKSYNPLIIDWINNYVEKRNIILEYNCNSDSNIKLLQRLGYKFVYGYNFKTSQFKSRNLFYNYIFSTNISKSSADTHSMHFALLDIKKFMCVPTIFICTKDTKMSSFIFTQRLESVFYPIKRIKYKRTTIYMTNSLYYLTPK